MDKMLSVLKAEKTRLETILQSPEKMEDEKKAELAKRLELTASDIERMELFIGRPSMQTFSEMHFIDDVRMRVKEIQAENENRANSSS